MKKIKGLLVIRACKGSDEQNQCYINLNKLQAIVPYEGEYNKYCKSICILEDKDIYCKNSFGELICKINKINSMK